jgi:hypothetical protein
MKMRFELIRDLMLRLDEKVELNVGNCDAVLEAQIEKSPLPMDLKRVFQWSWANNYGTVGNYRIHSVKDAFANERFDLLIKANMIGIGSARNGDMLVVRFSNENCEVGFLNHIELAVAIDEDKAPHDFYVKVCGTLDELLFRLIEDRYLPIDYWAALELSELHSELQKEDQRPDSTV